MKTDSIHRDESFYETRATSQAVDEALRDSDELCEYLRGHCYRMPVSTELGLLREVTAEDFVSWRTSDLVALMFDRGQPGSTTIAARDALADRYLNSDLVSQAIDRRVARLVADFMQEAA